ncbi:hypothetical protein SKAU_G00372860 [Synaphobranchus kaupii]|uniref:Uncharacterized protein n=1 Tax=Synaphobranchus kaupii TaxID=118154 RepID=A0A9Q1EGF2_SYNKA|nr:hypothetical protein SKAU_G00372860 [Synaphobranchus kaupii]
MPLMPQISICHHSAASQASHTKHTERSGSVETRGRFRISVSSCFGREQVKGSFSLKDPQLIEQSAFSSNPWPLWPLGPPLLTVIPAPRSPLCTPTVNETVSESLWRGNDAERPAEWIHAIEYGGEKP